ncbi:MAG: pentapeptide repeat-containing protein [Rhizobiaceae bacterium]|nr:pentapeptide repeat-containing protein [Rhizobiaceae bacterium]
MSETLSTHSSVVLFGKIVEDLKVIPEKKSGVKASDAPAFARIYGFSFGGAYSSMAAPTLMLVHGPGIPAIKAEVAGPGLDDDDPFYKSLKVWAYDQSDDSTMLDVSSGTIEQLLLNDPGYDGPRVSGAKVSGAKVAGAKVAGAKVSGAKVAGAKVSGAKLSGARVSGAKLSGARGDASD